ncbi:hypothetical protein Glove_38g49 [Diversispora epigaea]|uniref:Uncharacterized protein n=1 Tax=Diversispora epigaea TaxID=1348612 RepID=A0A397JI13_9GLOM|nr:hypothetical protein Glove_38g49 [Diversispora epigaea]
MCHEYYFQHLVPTSLKKVSKRKLILLHELCLLISHVSKHLHFKDSSPEKIASDIDIPELDPCPLCNQELFLFEIKNPITILKCSICPKLECKKEVEFTIDSMPGSQNTNDLMDMSPTIKDTKIHESTSQKRTDDYLLFPDKPSDKKQRSGLKRKIRLN